MKALYFTTGDKIYEVVYENSKWVLHERETPAAFRCLAVDSTRDGRIYAGSFDDGLWMSNDRGVTWKNTRGALPHQRVLSIAVSESEQVNGKAVIWAGTEPSHLYRSEDGGKTWEDCAGLQRLKSKPEWSFPPRPHTHHVRFIQPDIHQENRIFAGIELGGVMQSNDKGQTWQDRKKGSQYDCHTLTMTPLAKDRIYEAAGGGFAESTDGGLTWQTINHGLDPYTYLVEVAVDAGDPDTIIASAAKSARTAYDPEGAHTVLMRKEKGKSWEIVKAGLPDPDGASIFTLLADNNKTGSFFAVNNLGVYQSTDKGVTWNRLSVEWPDHLEKCRIHALTSKE